jgi:integrase
MARTTPRRPAASGRARHKLTQKRIAELIAKHVIGDHSDGGCLYLRIKEHRWPSWVLIYATPAKPRNLFTLGPYSDPSDLARTRVRAAEELAKRDVGIDPLKQRREARKAEQVAPKPPARTTLRRELYRVAENHVQDLRNAKNKLQWPKQVETHIPARILDKHPADVEPQELLDVLGPLRRTMAPTVKKIRQRLDIVYDDCIFRKICSNNPAAAIRKRLIKFGRHIEQHFRSLPWFAAPALAKDLRALQDRPSARPLEFLLLTAARSGEVRNMRWDQVDLKRALWVLPGEDTKMDDEHTVYLCPRAIELIEAQRDLDPVLVFPSLLKLGEPWSDAAMRDVLKDLKYHQHTVVHGLRSCFSTWANEHGYGRDAIEACLSHKESDRVRAAYNHAEFADERRRLLHAWGAYLQAGTPGKVIELPAPKKGARKR